MAILGYPDPDRPLDPEAWRRWAADARDRLPPEDADALVAIAERKIAILTKARAPNARHPADAPGDKKADRAAE